MANRGKQQSRFVVVFLGVLAAMGLASAAAAGAMWYWLTRAPASDELAAGNGAKERLAAPPEPAHPLAPPASSALGVASGFAEGEDRIIQLFEAASPSVVFITTVDQGHDLRFNVFEIPRGTGSGFVWDNKGHIVTNYHVIRNARGARVSLADGSVYRAGLVGRTRHKDIAVLHIDAPADKLRPISRGSSQKLRVGQTVLAIGNPFGLDHTLSTGVISGLGREIRSLTNRPIQGVIQTDAVINPGNSGGPLLDSAGRLIGINTAIYSPTGVSAGVGFAVPVDTVKRVVPQLIEHGRVMRPLLGIILGDELILRRLGLQGVLVWDVAADGPAAAAGIRPLRRVPSGDIVFDVITGIDEQQVRNHDDLYRILDRHAVGDEVAVRLRRAAGTLQVRLRLAAARE
ncbi:MAG: trypsin-like peptidase domain-containing protein [Proteobacteria bacterium]|nr:trypsin-like peptidase domain-containing protein [Pseudomonadota bacterium]